LFLSSGNLILAPPTGQFKFHFPAVSFITFIYVLLFLPPADDIGQQQNNMHFA
jgi:hypothetical protein